MLRTLRKIKRANTEEIELFLDAVIQRRSALYPDWDLNVISIQKSADENEQIDQMIAALERLPPGV